MAMDEKDWPGLNPKPDQITYSASKLKKIAADLAADLERLGGNKAGSLQDFTKYAVVPTIMDNEAGSVKDFFDSVAGGSEGFRTIYSNVVAQYQNAILLMLEGAKGFHTLDQRMGGSGTPEET
ncbi:hypothetical protein [Nonomuraea sediminis]|uniref:hypothetical protein n=1 Tax=Nonomuraea sediminis TaxID=2835864 RepID=UPI001BDCDC01|nr:hypothetical protein [Nonomuraea sediminis]